MRPSRSPTAIARLCCVAGFTVSAAMALAQSPNPQQFPPAPTAVPTNDTASQLTASRLITDAQASFSRVRDYTSLFYRQERVKGQLQPEQTIQLHVRQQPFSVHMKWLGPQKLVGQEAVFVAGKHNNQVKVKAAGALLGAMGFLNMDPNDSKIMATNRHPITEAGLGNLIERIVQGHEAEKRQPADQTTLSFAEFKFLNRPVTRMESTHRVNNGQFYCHRTVVFIDKESRLPVRFEAYDWPRAGSTPTGELLESYSFVDVKFNVGLTDSAFAH